MTPPNAKQNHSATASDFSGGEFSRELWKRAADRWGDRSAWPQGLTTAAQIVLAARQPAILWWGPDLVQIYNSSFAAVLGHRHPGALVSPASQTWPANESDIAQKLAAALKSPTAQPSILALPISGGDDLSSCELACTVLRNGAGGIDGLFGTWCRETAPDESLYNASCQEEDQTSHVKALTRLHDLAMQLAGTMTLQPALQAIVETLVEIHNGDFGLLSVYEPTDGYLATAASIGLDDATLDVIGKIMPYSDVAANANTFITKRRIIVPDIEEDSRFEHIREVARAAGFRAIHSTPILTMAKDILGILTVYFKSPRTPTRRERQLANLCARYAAETIESARSRQALANSEERFSRFMRHLPGLAWIKDARGRYVYVNDAAERAFQTPRSVLYGKTDDQVFPQDTARLFRFNDEQALQGESGVKMIEALAQPDGVHHSLVSKFPIPGPDGTPALIGGIAIDVTEQVNAEQRLRDSEERFRGVTMNAPVSIFIKDMEGRYTLCNPVASESLGSPQGVIGSTDHDLVPRDVADDLRSHDLEVLAEGRAIEYEERVRLAGGERHYLSVKFPVRDSRGRTVGVGGVSVDVTERNKAEAALRESEQRLGLAIRAGKIGVWDWDIQNDRIAWSQSLYAIHGVEPGWFPENVEGFASLVHPDDRQRVKAAIAAALANDITYEVEFRTIRPGGEIVWLFTSAVVVREDGRPVRMQGATMDITETKRGESALRESEERFRTLASHAPVGIFQSDPTGSNVFVNESWCQMAGMTPDQARGTGWTDALHPDDRERVLAGWNSALKTATASEAEFRFLRPDGVVTWLQGNAVPLNNSAGESVGYLGTVVDITDRKKAEEALRNSERMYRAIGESIDYGVWVCDGEGRNIYCSESFLKLLGVNQEECSNAGWADALHPDDREHTLAAWQECVRSGDLWDIEHRFRGADGAWKPILARGVPVKDDNGEIIAWVGINLDISQLKKAENELRESEARFRSMADNAPVLIWVTGASGCQYVNREYLRFVGVGADELTGMGWTKFVHPDDVDSYVRAYLEGFSHQRSFEGQVRMLRADGEFRWVSSAAAPRFRADGTFAGYVGCSVDVTDMKASEDALREADRRKDEFLAMLGHELRNPLAGIVTGAQVLSELRLAPEAAEMQAVISRQASYMSRIVDDLLDVSRIARGKLTLQEQHVNLSELLRHVAADSERSHRLDDCRIERFIPDQNIWVWGDATRLTQAFSNVLHNSFKFSDGPNVISLSMNVSDNFQEVIVSIADRGIGMTQDTLNRIFEPFNQADTSLNRSRGGLGLGLALAKGLMELHGGCMAATSGGLGAGSEFTFRLPTCDAPPGAMAEERTLATPSKRVLIIDDRRDAILPVSKFLEMCGHTVATAMDGPAGLATAAEFMPDVVLCDIGLSGAMNGYEVSQAIRATPPIAAAYLVAVTGYGQEEDRRLARNAGFDYHVTKPLGLDQIEDLLSKMPRF